MPAISSPHRQHHKSRGVDSALITGCDAIYAFLKSGFIPVLLYVGRYSVLCADWSTPRGFNFPGLSFVYHPQLNLFFSGARVGGRLSHSRVIIGQRHPGQFTDSPQDQLQRRTMFALTVHLFIPTVI